MMKRIFLLALGACALAGNVLAQESATVYRSVPNSQGGYNDALVTSDGRSTTVTTGQSGFDSRGVYTDTAVTKEIALAPQQEGFWQKLIKACKVQDLNNRARYAAFRASINGGRLVDGDPIPSIANLYDDAAAIRLYLHDSGYSDLSDGEIAKVRAYMRAQGIRHVAQLGQ